MAFESLSHQYEFTIQDFPPEWLPLTYLYDPDLPLFPVQYFHVLDPALQPGHRPGERDRLFGFIHHINLNGTNLSVTVITNKDLGADQFKHYKTVLEKEVRARLGLENPVKLDDLTTALTGKLAPANNLIKELWYQVIDGSFGKSLPFGRMWDPVMGLVRFVASWNSDGGRKGELIQTHSFVSEFGAKIQTGSGIHVDFFLLPTYEELIDTSNPLRFYPEFSTLVQASNEFVEKYCDKVDIGTNQFSAFKLSRADVGTKLNTQVKIDIIEKANPGFRKALFENYSAFNRGPQRSIIFLLMLHDLRQSLWDPSTLTPAECGLLYTELSGSYQTPKVIELYAQQCFGSEVVLPIDNWVETFLHWPFGFKPSAKKKFYEELFATSNVWGKLERLIWIAAQARKVHSSVCKEILWCVRYGGREKEMRGANPLACKICEGHIRDVCPGYAAIADMSVAFNSTGVYSVTGAVFNVMSSEENNEEKGQTFTYCEAETLGTKDIYSTHDRPEKFKPYPQAEHSGGALKVSEFIQLY